jgi:hypothetical protein
MIKMAHKKEVLFGLILLTAFMFSIVGVLGAVINPANSATISGTAILNATNVSLPDMVNCTFYAKSASTANSSWTSLGTFTNATSNPLNINGTFSSAILEDSSNYQFNATCRNLSNSLTSNVGTATVIIDNTIPQAPSSLSPSDKTVKTTSGAQTFSSTVTDANTTSCTYWIARNHATSGTDYITGAGTYSTSTCSFSKTFSTTADNGIWTFGFTASDGTNSTSSSENELQVNLPGSGGGYIPGTPSGQVGEKEKQGFLVFGLIVAVLAIIISWLIFKKR